MIPERRRVLMMQPLMSFRTLRAAVVGVTDPEPGHPHHGLRLANELERLGFDVSFVNQLEWKLPLPARFKEQPRFQVLNARLHLNEFDAVLTYAEGGLKFIASTLWRRQPRMVPVLLTNQRPATGRLARAMRSALYRAGVSTAGAVVCCLRDIEGYCRAQRRDVDGIFYAPTAVDTSFFDPAQVTSSDALADLQDRSFVLLVGDHQRDDELAYTSLKHLAFPVVRVTRDPSLRNRIQHLLNPERGDLILEFVTFGTLRWLYTGALVAIITSQLDHWQAAGSTALTEAMSCGTPTIVQAGGCLEREFRPMTAGHAASEALQFVPAVPTEIESAVIRVSRLSSEERTRISAALREFAVAELPLSRAHSAFASALRRAVS